MNIDQAFAKKLSSTFIYFMLLNILIAFQQFDNPATSNGQTFLSPGVLLLKFWVDHTDFTDPTSTSSRIPHISALSRSYPLAMPLSAAQKDLLDLYSADYNRGLTAAEATERRRKVDTGGLNSVGPPIKCPSWVCCLLPCIKHIPSMKLHRQIRPEDAEVRRGNRWVRYDAPSLVRGDIIRVEDGDIVPADCTVLSLGLEPVDLNAEGGQGANDGASSSIELVVDVKDVTGECKPRVSRMRSDGTAAPVRLLYGSHVNQGACIAVVTAVGEQTLLASLMKDGRWPPKCDLSLGLRSEVNVEDEEIGLSLVERAT